MNTFPGPGVFGIEAARHVAWMEIQVAPNIGILVPLVSCVLQPERVKTRQTHRKSALHQEQGTE